MTKIIFHFLNIIFVFLYIYPGSLLGFLIYNDISKQPQISPDFIISSNHLYAFLFLSSLGLIGYYESTKKIILYLILVSIILELFHLFIPFSLCVTFFVYHILRPFVYTVLPFILDAVNTDFLFFPSSL